MCVVLCPLFRYILLMYHAAQVLLSCPSEDVIWSATLDGEWISSGAFLKAQEHAIRATALLEQVIGAGISVQQLCAPFFQFCVVRVGLVHLAYQRIASAAVEALATTIPDQQAQEQLQLLQEAERQVNIHTTTLFLGQVDGIKGDGVAQGANEGTFWFRAWNTAVAAPLSVCKTTR